MALWDDIVVDFGGSETANFGPRQETGTALYQVDTMVTISPRGEVIKNPEVRSAICDTWLCVSAGKQVSIFEENCQQLFTTLTFDSEIDVISWSFEAEFLLVGESRGLLHFIYVPKKKLLFSQTLVNDANENNVFLSMNISTPTNEGHCELFILTCKGSLFRFSNIYFHKLHSALESSNYGEAKRIQNEINCEVVNLRNGHSNQISHVCLSDGSENPLIISAGNNSSVLNLWKKEANKTFSVKGINGNILKGLGAVKAKNTQDGYYLFVLDKQHFLSVWDLQSLVMLKRWSEISIEDFVLMEVSKNNSSSLENLKLILLINQPDKSACFLQLRNMPKFETTYTLKVGMHSTLVECPQNQESIFIIEGVSEDDNRNLLSSLRIRCLTETMPEMRLSRLLSKRQFDEAEKFAILFNLDLEHVYKVKSTTLLDQLSPWSDSLESDENKSLFLELMNCLHKIKDDKHVIECCIQPVPTAEMVLQLLMYSRNRLKEKKSETQVIGETPPLLTKVLKVLHRFDTFVKAFGIDHFSCQFWADFAKGDMLNKFLDWLHSGEMHIANIIWKHFQNEFKEKFNEMTLQNILSSIPETITSHFLKYWLAEDFIPFVLRMIPHHLDKVATWLEQKVRNMELSEKNGWPENAVRFAEVIGVACCMSAGCYTERGFNSPAQYCVQIQNRSLETFARLDKLVHQLKSLHHLHKDYKCKLSLAEYCQETVESLAFRMLDRVQAIELIPLSIQNIVRPYVKENGLDENKLLYNYIKDLLQYTGRVVYYWGNTTWEDRAVAVINCVIDVEYKCLAILEIVKHAHLPWTEEMQILVNECLLIQHPKIKELQEQCGLIELKTMLMSYDLKDYAVSDTNKAELLLKYILSKDQPTVMKDALQIVSTYPSCLTLTTAYFFRICNLIRTNQILKAMELIKSLDKTEAFSCSKRLISYTIVILNDEPIIRDKQQNEEEILFTEATIYVIQYILAISDQDNEDMHILLENMQNIRALQLEFNEHISFLNFNDEVFKQELLLKHLKRFCYQSEPNSIKEIDCQNAIIYIREKKPSQQKKINYSKMYRLGELLGISHDELRAQLCLKAAKNGEIETAISMCDDFFTYLPKPESAKVLYNVASTLCQLQANGEIAESIFIDDLSYTIHELASQALTVCPSDSLLDCLELSKYTALATSVHQHCEKGDYNQVIKEAVNAKEYDKHGRNLYREWTLNPFFKEDGLVWDSAIAIPLAYKLVVAATNSKFMLNDNMLQEKASESSQNISNESNDESTDKIGDCQLFMHNIQLNAFKLIKYVKQCNQLQLGLRALTMVAGTSIQRVSDQCMGYISPDKDVVAKIEKVQDDIITFVIKVVPLLREFTTSIVSKILTHRYVDHDLSLGYLNNLPENEAFFLLKKITDNIVSYKKLLAISKIGLDLSLWTEDASKLIFYKSLEVDAEWGKRLQKLDICFREMFGQSPEEKISLLPQIVQHPKVDLELIKSYCRSYELEDISPLMILQYLEMLLISPHSKGSGLDSLNKDKAMDKELELLFHKANLLIEEIQDSDVRLKYFTQIINKIDSYDYETLSFLLHHIDGCAEPNSNEKDFAEKGIKVLEFLKIYSRVNQPSEYEISFKSNDADGAAYQMLFAKESSLSSLSVSRLPFHALMEGNSWKIVGSELNLKTLPVWLTSGSLLKLSDDDLYATTIQSVMKAAIQKNFMANNNDEATRGKMILKSTHQMLSSSFLETIHSLLMKISSYEKALACAKWIVMELPIGPEKNITLKACCVLAQKWLDFCANKPKEEAKAKESKRKFVEIYRRLSTEQCLNEHNLNNPDLLSLAMLPAKLIFKMYEHPSIQQRLTQGALGNFPDIHTAAAEVADINSCNIQKIHLTLIEKWLPPIITKAEDADSTMTFNFNMSVHNMDIFEEDSSEDETNLKRVMYILQYGSMESNVLFLLNVINENDSFSLKLRAMQCLFAITDDKTIVKFAGKSIHDLRNEVQSLIYVSELEKLHIPHSVKMFEKCSKEGLVRGIWRNHSHENKAVRLVSDLCLDYQILDIQLWNSILQQLLAFNMIKYLRYVLQLLSHIPDMWQVTSFIPVWTAVITMPLKAVIPPLNEVQNEECLRSAVFLYGCPLALDLPLKELSQLFEQIELPLLALSCLLLLPAFDTEKTKLIQKLFNKSSSVYLLQQLELYTQAKKHIPFAIQARITIFETIKTTEKYSQLQNSKFWEEFLEHWIQEDEVLSVIEYYIKRQCLDVASDVVKKYHKVYPHTESAKLTVKEKLSSKQELKAFLKWKKQ